MAMDHDFPRDVMAEILLRLPPSSRRRARLVCRLWRDVVNERTTEAQSRPKLLLWRADKAIAYVSSDLSSPSPTGSCTELWRYSEPGPPLYALQLVGTCNGLLCLCDNTKGVGGTITLLNPATGEELPVRPLPCAESFIIGTHRSIGWGYAYHPTTGQYKVVHVPSSHDRVCEFNAVHVLTLGEPTWREVPVDPGDVITRLAAGIVSVDGMTYWVRVTGGGAAKIMSFDLNDERVVSTTIPLPVRRDHYRLAEVHGRLGFIAGPNVWVLEEGQRWSHRYNFKQDIPRRHFV
ncbi:F-box protein At3g07870-like [Aegilops tauschii subsp. strangulata]|uniref:Uncharacterized protein n=1 Tax=Aegilops tauschii TaxID=37682 RepID=R7W515_AEGTA|nr:F-box protein At3g07870-like [Aegilops tauschii subsp. strangulata]